MNHHRASSFLDGCKRLFPGLIDYLASTIELYYNSKGVSVGL
jgi:hypothetical protein